MSNNELYLWTQGIGLGFGILGLITGVLILQIIWLILMAVSIVFLIPDMFAKEN